ncbi:hypothetical protein DSCW_35260 [Desulfosarcina widdelii]|uniref:Lipoprotein n=1 Tax=Desulfosarcina widdelii TaxID=947919 RepID=A0A5K7Z7H7_9BACT|nr:hypothetical protein [Desulfosarcina widdelii]BBO76109.1 hypothetical protein DSCW_35260 [Desulfosarcina widdelii]
MPYRIVALIAALLMAWAAGCTHRTPDEPEREKAASVTTTAGQSGLSSPSVPSKGTGVKKKMPVKVKTGDRLGWVDNAVKTYPPDRFLTGVGIAPDRKTAEQRALSELKKPFAKAIAGRITMQREAIGKLSHPLDRELIDLSATRRESSLEDVLAFGRVAEIFVEKKPQTTIYALAVLDRPACTLRVESLVRQLDHQLKKIIDQSEQPGDRMQPGQKKELLQIFVRREALDAALELTNKTGKGVPMPVSQQALARFLKKK